MKSPISRSTVSLQEVCLGAAGCKDVAGLVPTHLQLLGERRMKRERRREKRRRERENDRSTVGIKASRVQAVSRLSSCGITGFWVEPCVCSVVWVQEAALLRGYGQIDSSLRA